MQIEMVATSTLIPYARNAKLHNDAQVSAIAGSIKEFGFNNPVLIDSACGIIAGHGRVLAAQKLGLKEVPCIVLDHLTENQKKAYIIADNRLAETGGGWDREMLKIELDDVDWGELPEFNLDDLGTFEWPEVDGGLSGDGAGSEAGSSSSDSTYTNKIVAPIYTPKGERPPLKDLYDRTKTQNLIDQIDATNMPEEIKQFMRVAAERHTVFNFRQIAEYYCHADVTLQDLMERSGMIIIDFKKAIEYGFVHMTEQLGQLADLEESSDEE